MDLWGFDGRQREEIPGEDFSFLEVPGPGPAAGPGGGPGASGGAGDPPPIMGAGYNSSGDRVEPSADFNAAQGSIDSEYGSIGSIARGRGFNDFPSEGDFHNNPGSLRTWWDSHSGDARANWPTGFGDRVTRVATFQDRLNTARNHLRDARPASSGDAAARRAPLVTAANEADTVTRDVFTAYNGGNRPPAAPGGGGGGGNGVGTASAGPGGVAGLREGVRGATGLLADTAALGAAARTNQAIWGGGNGGSYGINVADGMGNTSAFGGPGGGFGGVGTAGYGGVGGFGGGMDLSNTGFGIGMQGGEARAKSRQLDAMINQLLAAIAMGNLDAITSALTMCNLKAKSTMSQAATHVVRAMQLYDRQMRTISDQMGAIAGQSGNNPNTGAQMGHLNSEMNQISMSRQAISNMLRDIMSMNEEMSNMEKSIYDVKSREASFYRWS